MSATAAAPPHIRPQRGPRRSGTKPRPSDNLEGTIPTAGISTETQQKPSPASGHMNKNNHKSQNRKVSHNNNKSQSEAAPKHGNNHHEKAKATPMKSPAYAGSAFQQSPAASALPLPSFYSKSLPIVSSLPPQPETSESASSQSSSTVPIDDSPSKRESTPCDFLFEAARQARATPRAESPATRSGNLSVQNGSPASRSPAPREGDPMFPFELEGGGIPGEDGSAFATPYKDRIEAVRSTKSTSSGGKSMDENERKAKSDALKKLLMKSSRQGNDNEYDSGIEMNNPFNARAPYQQGPPPLRHSSGPSTPVYMQEKAGYNFPPNFSSGAYQFPPGQMHTPKRPNSSRLRHVYEAQSEPEYAELSSDSAITSPISSRKHAPQQIPHHNPRSNMQPYATQSQIPTHRARPSAQQLEDDLRRVLKLDLTSRG